VTYNYDEEPKKLQIMANFLLKKGTSQACKNIVGTLLVLGVVVLELLLLCYDVKEYKLT
jgi:hypothetical protein